ncbi:MAG: dienelactone hydrolase family protein [Verrucomicrobia bacterium]|nr:dienelactone hydrolase family protein [Verrucomicrobiota bacterium]
MRATILIVVILMATAALTYADEKLPVLKAGNVTYSNVTVTAISSTDIFFTYPGGMGNAKLKALEPELQKHFHYDPIKGEEAEKAKAKANLQYRREMAAQPTPHLPDNPLATTAALDPNPTPSGGVEAQYILIKPQNYNQARKYPLFIFMHGQGDSLKAMLHFNGPLFSHQDFFVLLPQAPDRLGDGFSWYDRSSDKQFEADLNRDEQIVKQMIEEVEATYNIDRSQLILSGFSAGGRLTFHIGFRNPKLFKKIVPVCGAYMPNLLDSHVANLEGLKVRIYHGTEDTTNPFAKMKESYENLQRKGVDVTMTTYPMGHGYTLDILSKVLGEVGQP